jgi:hypothetical protein
MYYYWRILDLTSGEIVVHPFAYKSYKQCLYAVKRYINYRNDRSLKRVCTINITTDIDSCFPITNGDDIGWSPV